LGLLGDAGRHAGPMQLSVLPLLVVAVGALTFAAESLPRRPR
jgi:hypothetical protein